jgi:hypothetical protein
MVQAAAANPTNIEHNFQLLKAVLDRYQFKPENVYGFDESGLLFGDDSSGGNVFTSAGAMVYQQAAGDKENVAAMVTICADGMYITPTIIFKGKNMSLLWHDANLKLKVK